MQKQHSEEWVQARLGKATASRASDWMATLRTGGVPAVRENYITELALERLTDAPFPSYVSQAMLTGIEREPDARAAYAFWANVDVVECGFIPHPTIPNAGASPDGLIGDDGLVEFKCPNETTHRGSLLNPGKIPKVYLDQVMFQMACTGRQWCDFVSYNPIFPESMRLVVARVMRSDLHIERLEKEVKIFLLEVAGAVARLLELYPIEELPERAPCPPSEPSTPTGDEARDGPRNDAGAMLLLQR